MICSTCEIIYAQELNNDSRTEQIAKQQAFITLKDKELHWTYRRNKTLFSEQKLFKRHGTIKTHLDTQRQQHQFYN